MMFSPSLKNDRRIFFPWEGRGGLRRFLAMGRFGPILAFIAIGLVTGSIVARERRASGDRRTRVALDFVRPGVERYLLENEGKCPTSLEQVREHLTRKELPLDGWGQPLRLVCPSARANVAFVLMSDGPDGIPGGLDRIEH